MVLGDCQSTMTNALGVEDGGVVDFPNGTHEKKLAPWSWEIFPIEGIAYSVLHSYLFVFVHIVIWRRRKEKRRRR
jgi:hypothetical protein